MSVLENYFLESIKLNNGGTLLREEIYRRPETKLIDAEFDKIMKFFAVESNMLSVRKKEIDPNDKFKKELASIEELIKKLFNAKIILKFDVASKFDKLSFGMCIFSSNEEMHRRVQDAIEHPGKGFHLYECNNSMVWIDYAMISILLKNKIKEGRYLTAVLLHELGHKVYVESQHKIRTYGPNRNIAPKEEKTKTAVGTLGGLALIFAGQCINLTSVPSDIKGAVSFISGIIGVIMSSSFLIKASDIADTETYVASEHLSDLTAVKYGYGMEIAKIMDIFYAMSKVKLEKMNKILRWFNKSANKLNADKLRRDEVKKALEAELNDSKNSTVEKKHIKSILDAIKKMETLNEEYNEDSFIMLGEAFQNLEEALTFRSADMSKIRHMLHSKKVIEKVASLHKKGGWKIIHKATELNPLNLKVVENKIREIAEHSVTKTVGGSVGEKVEVGGGVSETSLKLRNVVLMEVGEYLCIIEGTDKGRVISCTILLVNDIEMLKFVRIQHSAFKF